MASANDGLCLACHGLKEALARLGADPSPGGVCFLRHLDERVTEARNGSSDAGLDGRGGRESATQEKKKKLLHKYTNDIDGRTHPPTRWVSDHVRVRTIVPI
jgi:hypothetical protein